MSLNHKSHLPTYLLLLAVIVVWGLVWPICKIGLAYISPLWFVEIRLIIAAFCMFLLVAVLGKLQLPRRRDLPMLIVIGILQIFLFLTLLTIGLKYVGAGKSAILTYTTPIWVTPIAFLVFKEKVPLLKLIGVLLGAAGIIILVSPWGVDWTDKSALLGNILLILAAISWSCAMLFTRYMPWHSSPLVMAPWQQVVALIPMTIVTLILEPTPHIIYNHALLGSILFASILATAFAYWGIVHVTKELPVVTTSISLLTVPVFSVIASYFMLDEAIDLNMLIAMILIITGLMCATLSVKISKGKPKLTSP